MLKTFLMTACGLFMSSFFVHAAATHEENNAACMLRQTPITLGYFDEKLSEIVKLSPQGTWLGVVDIFGNAQVWDLGSPEFPIYEIRADPADGQIFVNVSFSPDGRFIIFDSSGINTSLPTLGRIVVVSTQTWTSLSFNTDIWGGTSRSKFAISSRGLLAYVPYESDHEILLVDLTSKRVRSLVKLSRCEITALAFDPTAKNIAIKDICAKSITLVDVDSGRVVKEIVLDTSMPDDIFSPDQTVFFWGEGSMLAVNSDQQECAVGLNIKTGGGQFPFVWFMPLAMFMSNGSTMLAIADETCSLNIEKLNDDELYIAQPFGSLSFVLAGAYAPSDMLLAVGSDHGEVAVLKSENLETLCRGALLSQSEIQQIVFSREDSFISLTADFILTPWHIEDQPAQRL